MSYNSYIDHIHSRHKIAYCFAVVHDAAVIVLHAHVIDRVHNVKVVLKVWIDVFKVDPNVFVAVRSRLLMPETNGVSDFVHDNSFLKRNLNKSDLK